MTAYMIDSTIGPIPVVSDELIITDRARFHLGKALWISPEALPALLLRAASEIATLPECQRPMYVEQFCNNLKGNEPTT